MVLVGRKSVCIGRRGIAIALLGLGLGTWFSGLLARSFDVGYLVAMHATGRRGADSERRWKAEDAAVCGLWKSL